MSELASKFKEITVDPDDLLLDPNNPRYQGDFPGFIFVPYEQIGDQTSQDRAFERINLPRFNVRQLAESIAEIGYLPIDRLIVTKYRGDKFLVVEGNRRLAALRLILNGEVGTTLPL